MAGLKIITKRKIDLESCLPQGEDCSDIKIELENTEFGFEYVLTSDNTHRDLSQISRNIIDYLLSIGIKILIMEQNNADIRI